MSIKSAAPKQLGKSRYVQLADEMRHRMRAGTLSPGDRLPSFAEMRAQGISQNTMEKVFAILEKEHLVERRHRAGVFVADVHEVKPKTGIIGVSGKGFSFKEYSSYWGKLLRGIREACDEADSQILLLDFESNKGWEKADGVLICDWSNQVTMQWLPPQMPCVSVLVPAVGMPSVYADDYQGGREATEHLLKLGHKKIAHLHSGDVFVSGRRLAGYRDALRDVGIKAREEWSHWLRGKIDFDALFIERGCEMMQAWLESDWKKLGCTAIIAQNDETAVGIIKALREAKLRVPGDISVVGFDGASAHEYSAPRLTTVEVPLEEIGKTAARLLVRQLKGEAIGNEHRVFPVTLREGRSTAQILKKRKA